MDQHRGRRSGPAGIFLCRLLARMLVASTLAATATIAVAQSLVRWEIAVGSATAFLPPPVETRGIDAVQLACAEQRWTLLLRMSREAGVEAGSLPARLVATGVEFALEAKRTPRGYEARVPREALDPLKRGNVMAVTLGEGEGVAGAELSLRGSRDAIEAIAPLCTPKDMSAYETVALVADGAAVEAATRLMQKEIRLFRNATGKSPEVRATFLDVAEGKVLLFVTICGPGGYFGDTGCNYTVHAAEDGGEFAQVYNTEGVGMYLDPAPAASGWPNLVTLPLGEDEEIAWAWNGAGYAPR